MSDNLSEQVAGQLSCPEPIIGTLSGIELKGCWEEGKGSHETRFKHVTKSENHSKSQECKKKEKNMFPIMSYDFL